MKIIISLLLVLFLILIIRQIFFVPKADSHKVLAAKTFIPMDPKIVFPIVSVSPTIYPPPDKTILEPAIININAEFIEQKPPLNPVSLENLFLQYAAFYNVDKNLLIKIADCESEFNPQAVNGEYGGLYQFTPSTWAVTRREMNLPENEADRYNSEEAIKTAAYKISKGGLSSWPACSK